MIGAVTICSIFTIVIKGIPFITIVYTDTALSPSLPSFSDMNESSAKLGSQEHENLRVFTYVIRGQSSENDDVWIRRLILWVWYYDLPLARLNILLKILERMFPNE
jgi:hypothetical protein